MPDRPWWKDLDVCDEPDCAFGVPGQHRHGKEGQLFQV